MRQNAFLKSAIFDLEDGKDNPFMFEKFNLREKAD